MYEIYKNYFGYIFRALECDDDIIFNSKMQDDIEPKKKDTFCYFISVIPLI